MVSVQSVHLVSGLPVSQPTGHASLDASCLNINDVLLDMGCVDRDVMMRWSVDNGRRDVFIRSLISGNRSRLSLCHVNRVARRLWSADSRRCDIFFTRSRAGKALWRTVNIIGHIEVTKTFGACYQNIFWFCLLYIFMEWRLAVWLHHWEFRKYTSVFWRCYIVQCLN